MTRELKKQQQWNIKVMVIPIVVSTLGTVSKGLNRRLGRVENRTTNQDHPNYRNVKIDLNTEKSPVDLRGLSVTQTPVKVHQLLLSVKKLARNIEMIIGYDTEKIPEDLGALQ